MLCWDKYIQISNISDPNCIYMDSICCYAVGCIMFKCDMVSDSVSNHRFCSEFFLALISVWILTEIWQLFVFRLLNCKIECFDCRMQDPCGLWSFRIHLGHPRQPFFHFQHNLSWIRLILFQLCFVLEAPNRWPVSITLVILQLHVLLLLVDL